MLYKQAFNRFQNNTNICCESLPSIRQNSINSWVKNVEQKSIELALEYDYLFETDITNCYGAIYTHSIPWAIHTKETAKNNRNDNELIGNKIDKLLQGMNYGQTNGIPQGSILMDFIAEIVLGYIDEGLSEKIKGIKDYKIIRFRDDYRIFTNNLADGKLIIKELSNILAEMGMRLGAEKTRHTNDTINNSFKIDKLQVMLSNRKDSYNLQKQLIYIKNFAEKYSNSGQLISYLTQFKNELSKQLNYKIKNKNLLCVRYGALKKIRKIKHKKLNTQSIIFISILTNIALKNPRHYKLLVAIISEIICKCYKNDDKKAQIINKIRVMTT